MLDSINIAVNNFDWKAQKVGDYHISNILANIENGHFRSKKIKLDISTIDLTNYSFSCPDLFEFSKHYKLVEKADLSYPVIINRRGFIVDGRHRLIKAILSGMKKIDAIIILDADILEYNN